MPKSIFSIYALLILFSSCKTSSILNESQTSTTQQVCIGYVGLGKDFILQSNFNTTATPNYKEPIKVSVSKVPFTKITYKTFNKAKALQAANVNINYIDSIPEKPNYIRLQIADKVSIVKALNNENNKDVKTYLEHNKTANIITSMSLALNKDDLNAIVSADALFLIEKNTKTYALQLYKKGVKTKLIWFNSGVVFEYKTSHCCWEGSRPDKIDIVDIVNQYNNCPNKTYKSANTAKNKIKNYYKF